MGCDIHCYIEQKINNKYEAVELCHEGKLVEFYDDRHYKLFGLLANVRDDGCICLPRGIPDDISSEIKQIIDDWWGIGHSHTWYMMDELIQYQKNNPDDVLLNKFIDRALIYLDLANSYTDYDKIRLIIFFDC